MVSAPTYTGFGTGSIPTSASMLKKFESPCEKLSKMWYTIS